MRPDTGDKRRESQPLGLSVRYWLQQVSLQHVLPRQTLG